MSSKASHDCARFIDELLERVDLAIPVHDSRRRRRQLAVDIVHRFVPSARLAGIDLRRLIVGRAPAGWRDSDLHEAGAAGFRHALVRGGQDEEVVRHLAAAAAAELMHRRWLVFAASLVDFAQGWFRSSRSESRAEIAGNRAGIDVGRILQARLAGRLTRDAARRKLVQLLCE